MAGGARGVGFLRVHMSKTVPCMSYFGFAEVGPNPDAKFTKAGEQRPVGETLRSKKRSWTELVPTCVLQHTEVSKPTR